MKSEIAEQIWDMKYRFKQQDGTPIDETVEDTWMRIAKSLSNDAAEEAQFYSALQDYKFLPAGRITAGAGTGRAVTLFNCYVMGTIPDSMSGIFKMLREAALTMQQGGGIGYDFSTIRPNGAPVIHVGSDASGPLSFMDVWNSMCMTIMSAGTRRGAMMATMRCDHPDIFDFIHAKKDANRLRKFNVSVLCTDEFMAAVEDNQSIALWHEAPPAYPDNIQHKDVPGHTYKWVPARDIWDAIMTSTYNQAEPGVIFIDRINKDNNLNYCETISATNPCGEQPLPPYGACLLGSINLTRMIENPFQKRCRINRDTLVNTVTTAVKMLDRVVDRSNFPLEAQEKEAKNKRRIGLGITGLADALAMMKIRYGSHEAVTFVNEIMGVITNTAYRASSEIAVEHGSFPLFDKDKFTKSTIVGRLDSGVKKKIEEGGIRNSHLISIAPTGTISLYAGNVSSGIEPIFALSYNRKVLQKDGTNSEEQVKDYAVQLFEEMFPGKELPPYFVTTNDLETMDHLRMQSTAQYWVDSSISKTINLPENIDFESFKNVYTVAYDTGCKGCTTYRPNNVTGSILSVDSDEKTADTEAFELEKRPDELEGNTYKVKVGNHAYYITITNKDGRPFEVFINTKDPQSYAWMIALSRMISAVFRRPHNSTFVVEELKAVFDPAGGGWWNGRYYNSIVAAIGKVIENHMISIGYMDDNSPKDLVSGKTCPKCGLDSLIMEAGCDKCLSCGYSKCS